MKNFKLYYIPNTQSSILITEKSFLHLQEDVNLCSTYDEHLSIQENNQSKLTFKMALYVNGELNYYARLFLLGTKFKLECDDDLYEYIFYITDITPSIGKNNIIYTFTCQDEISTHWSKRNLGYSFSTLDHGGVQSIYTIATTVLKENYLDSVWKVTTNDRTLNDKLITLEVDNSNPYNVIIEGCHTANCFMQVNYKTHTLTFIRKEDTVFSGFRYRPETNLKSLTASYSAQNLHTIMHVNGGTTADGEIVTIAPPFPDCVQLWFSKNSSWNTQLSDAKGKTIDKTNVIYTMKSAQDIQMNKTVFLVTPQIDADYTPTKQTQIEFIFNISKPASSTTNNIILQAKDWELDWNDNSLTITTSDERMYIDMEFTLKIVKTDDKYFIQPQVMSAYGFNNYINSKLTAIPIMLDKDYHIIFGNGIFRINEQQYTLIKPYNNTESKICIGGEYQFPDLLTEDNNNPVGIKPKARAYDLTNLKFVGDIIIYDNQQIIAQYISVRGQSVISDSDYYIYDGFYEVIKNKYTQLGYGKKSELSNHKGAVASGERKFKTDLWRLIYNDIIDHPSKYIPIGAESLDYIELDKFYAQVQKIPYLGQFIYDFDYFSSLYSNQMADGQVTNLYNLIEQDMRDNNIKLRILTPTYYKTEFMLRTKITEVLELFKAALANLNAYKNLYNPFDLHESTDPKVTDLTNMYNQYLIDQKTAWNAITNDSFYKPFKILYGNTLQYYNEKTQKMEYVPIIQEWLDTIESYIKIRDDAKQNLIQTEEKYKALVNQYYPIPTANGDTIPFDITTDYNIYSIIQDIIYYKQRYDSCIQMIGDATGNKTRRMHWCIKNDPVYYTTAEGPSEKINRDVITPNNYPDDKMHNAYVESLYGYVKFFIQQIEINAQSCKTAGVYGEIRKYEAANKELWRELYTKYSDYIYESVYENSDEVDSYALYNQAISYFMTLNKPTSNYSIEVLDLATLEQIDIPRLEVGNKIKIYNKMLNLNDGTVEDDKVVDALDNISYKNNELVITSIDYDLRTPAAIKVGVQQNVPYKSILEKLIQGVK